MMTGKKSDEPKKNIPCFLIGKVCLRRERERRKKEKERKRKKRKKEKKP